MKIVYLAAGAAGMYCGTCLHDNTLAAALHRAGHDVLLVPTYTPLRTDEANVSQQRVMFGGINVYLQQHLPLFRHTPWLLDRLLDSPRLLGWLSRMQSRVQAEKLGDLTVSMLRGAAGNQAKEIRKLVYWLQHEVRPDIVHLSNGMLNAMAEPIRQALGVPVVCSLTGEDVFLERLVPPYYEQARELMRQQAQHVDAYVALNRYYADQMSDYLRIDRGRVEVIAHGLKLEGHGTRAPGERPGPTIGYFARVCHDKGLHVLADAFRILARDEQLPGVRLHAAGYLGAGDRPYLQQIEQRLEREGLGDRFHYAGELDRPGKIAFLHSLDMMSVPTVYRESKGISLLEALANAVPIVVPRHGCFPELIEHTGGGLLHEPEDAPSLAAALRRLLLDGEQARRLGLAGQQVVQEHYNDQRMAERHVQLYERVLHARTAEFGTRNELKVES